MADASAVLLEQIRELQEQVNETSSHFHFDVTKSVKKAKKKQIEMQQEENSADMEEALKEMERELDGVRETYEGQIDALTDEKDRLMSQLEEWKQRAHVAEDERVPAAIAAGLTDSAAGVRRAAIDALGKLGSEAVRVHSSSITQIHATDDDAPTREAAGRALQALGARV